MHNYAPMNRAILSFSPSPNSKNVEPQQSESLVQWFRTLSVDATKLHTLELELDSTEIHVFVDPSASRLEARCEWLDQTAIPTGSPAPVRFELNRTGERVVLVGTPTMQTQSGKLRITVKTPRHLAIEMEQIVPSFELQ